MINFLNFLNREDSSLITSEIFNLEIENCLGNQLCELGFEKVRENLWVQDLGVGVRKVVTIVFLKGATCLPRWGYSLDYVPHFDNSWKKLYWHRTNKTVQIDIYPMYFDFYKYAFSEISTLSEFKNNFKINSPRILQDIQSFFSEGHDIETLVRILEKCLTYENESGWRFWNYVPFPLAYAFTLKKSGRTLEATQFLEEYINKINFDQEAKEKLIQRFALVNS